MKQNVELLSNKAQSRLTNKLLTLALAAFTGVTCLASAQPALAQSDDAKRFETPTVFQAAGPSAASIQSTVDQFRAALGTVNNPIIPDRLADAVKSTGMAAAQLMQPLLLVALP